MTIEMDAQPPLLRPDDYCRCDSPWGFKVQSNASEEPTSCLSCNRVIRLERLGLDALVRARLELWRRVADALYVLWTSDGGYANYADREMRDWSSELNLEGMRLTELVASRSSLYPFLGIPISIPAPIRLECPRCHGSLRDASNNLVSQMTCGSCRIAWVVSS